MTTLDPPQDPATASEQERQKNEQERQKNEQERQKNETARQTNEQLPQALPAAATITAVGGLATAALALIGADDVASLTRGAPVLTFAGAAALVVAVVVSASAAVLKTNPTKRNTIIVAYIILAVGLGCYLLAGVQVNGDPPAPTITMSSDAVTDATKVSVSASRLAFDERLYVLGRFWKGSALSRAVIGPEKDGSAKTEFVVGPQSGAARRLQVYARVIKNGETLDLATCTTKDLDRTCATAGSTLHEGLPAVSAWLDGMRLHVRVVGRARTPGLVGVRITRQGRELVAARPRIDQRTYRTTIRLERKHPDRNKRDLVCVAASYDVGTPGCNGATRNDSFIRVYPRFHARR
jgi:hypothetical protein